MKRGDRLSAAQKTAFNAYRVEVSEEMIELKKEALILINKFKEEYMESIHTGIKYASTQELVDKYYWTMSKLINVIDEQKLEAKEENIIYPEEILEIKD